MTRTVVTCDAEDTLAAAARRMWDGDCGCLPVVDAHCHVVGMVTDRDVCMAAYTTGKPLSELRVAAVMARSVASTRPDDSLQDAERTMRQHAVRRLPVLDERARVIGILSCNDLFRDAEDRDDRNDSDDDGMAAHDAVHLVRTMAAIGRRRQPRSDSEAPTHGAPRRPPRNRESTVTVTSRQMIVHGARPTPAAGPEPAFQPIARRSRGPA
jgi:CBS-domain-containing membrane protein